MISATLLSGLIEGSATVLALWLILRFAPRLSPDSRAWLWRFGMLKLALPVFAISQITLHVMPGSHQLIPTQPVVERSAPVTVPVSGPAEAGQPGRTDLLSIAKSEVSAPTTRPDDELANLLCLVWCAGFAICAGRAIRDTVRTRRVMKDAAPVSAPEALACLEGLCRNAALRCQPRMLCSDAAPSALVSGVARPSIVLPASLTTGPTEDLRLALAHEVGHIRRRDLAWTVGAWMIRSFLFFNPAAWLAERELRAAQESATDQEAVWISGAPVGAYGLMLLRAMSPGRAACGPSGLPMSDSFSNARRRLSAMKRFTDRRSPRVHLLTAGLIATGLGLLPSYRLAPAEAATRPDPPARPHSVIQEVEERETPSTKPHPKASKAPKSLSAKLEAAVPHEPNLRPITPPATKPTSNPAPPASPPHIEFVEERPRPAPTRIELSPEGQEAAKEAADQYNQRVSQLLSDQDARIAEYRRGADQREVEAEQRESEAQQRKREGEQRARAALLRAQVIHLRQQDGYRHAEPGQQERDKQQLADDQRQKDADAYQAVLDQHQRETDQWQRDFDARTIAAMKNETQRDIATARAEYQKRIKERIEDDATRSREAEGAESYQRDLGRSSTLSGASLRYVTTSNGLRFAIPAGYDVSRVQAAGKDSYTVVLHRSPK